MSAKYWLLKAEPDSRIVKGKDVKFSVDDFERVKTSPWEGVRNYEARNLMKEMRVGEKAVFYHSNCKNPGISAFAEVSKEAYPDYTAWDESHPYYDSKSDKDKPRWYMVDLTFTARAEHFIPLALLRYIADSSADALPDEIKYIGEDGVQAIKSMDLITRGRLSVQRVKGDAWATIRLLAENGGWEDINFKPQKKARTTKSTKIKREVKKAKKLADDGDSSPLSSLEEDDGDDGSASSKAVAPVATTRKRKSTARDSSAVNTSRRSSRRKTAN